MTDSIKLIRLTSGEEILCTSNDTGHEVEMINPTIIIPQGNGSIGLAPWLPYAKGDTITIKASSIMFMVEPAEQLADEYKSIHQTIVTPSKQIITG